MAKREGTPKRTMAQKETRFGDALCLAELKAASRLCASCALPASPAPGAWSPGEGAPICVTALEGGACRASEQTERGNKDLHLRIYRCKQICYQGHGSKENRYYALYIVHILYHIEQGPLKRTTLESELGPITRAHLGFCGPSSMGLAGFPRLGCLLALAVPEPAQPHVFGN